MMMLLMEKPVQTNTETDLIQRAQAGDRDAFGDLIYLHREAVIRVVYRMCGNMQVAEDAAQNAFIRAWQHIPRYQPKASFKSWLYRIAINAALDILRREKAVVDIDDVPLSTSTKIEKRIVKNERAALVQQAIKNLPETSRTVLVLREYEELSYKDIAETLEIPVGTVMSRLSYARKTLSKALRNCLEDV